MELHASIRLTAVLVAGHTLGYGFLWLAGLPGLVLAIAAVVFAISLIHAVAHHGMRTSVGAVVSIRVDRYGCAAIRTRDGALHTVQLGPRSHANGWFCVLHLMTPAPCPRLFVAAWSTDAGDFRRLRVFLKTRATPTPSLR